MTVAIAQRSPGRTARRKIYNAVFVALCVAATAIALLALSLILWSLLVKGVDAFNLHLFTHDTHSPLVEGENPDELSGLRNSIVGSAVMLAIAMLIALAVGILAGTWLAEFGGDSKYGHAVRFLNDVLLTAPSILIGLFVYQIMVQTHVPGFSGLAGAVALAILAVPVVARTTEDILSLQAQSLREAGSALGTPKWIVVRKIIWRAAGGGLLTGGLLAFARISGETAPLLFTAFGNPNLTWNPLDKMSSVPQIIFQYALAPAEDWNRIAWAGALLMAGVVLIINIIGRIVAREPRRS
jgi:phosphate transport system permease protein